MNRRLIDSLKQIVKPYKEKDNEFYKLFTPIFIK
jgi:hypothetical protein